MNHLFDHIIREMSTDSVPDFWSEQKRVGLRAPRGYKIEAHDPKDMSPRTEGSTVSTCTPRDRTWSMQSDGVSSVDASPMDMPEKQLQNFFQRSDSLPSVDAAHIEMPETHPGLPQQLVPLESAALGLCGDSLELLIAPGDIFMVPGTGRFAAIGTAGGFMGHAILVLQPPQCVRQSSPEADELLEIWPSEDVCELWKVRTIDSNRAVTGFTEVERILFVDRKTSRLTLCGEISLNGELSAAEHEVVEIWQSPFEIRSSLRPDLMVECVKEMYSFEQQWSEFTAMRAVFKSARIFREDKSESLTKIQACWTQKPICTSVAVTFWQRYFCKLAEVYGPTVDAWDLVLRWMPLKADRVLPGDLTSVLREVGWACVTNIPCIFRPMVMMSSPALLRSPPSHVRQVKTPCRRRE
eukprot:gnl/MRDRNA2_/MRDRNA2_27104_c0_seq1.p1 gnl/MRDRNA2_/MRDRNA2_27104_c0~~gnl/MRDRNA2_/MRDRNA2_27104_c0_seq1.p1  ORF type:complete len:410 (-),score=58.89 gnl/MRDRNA2_/MRDRNA2_27104_c0_seq1:109-1338(-)